jgi:hypothetical protein
VELGVTATDTHLKESAMSLSSTWKRSRRSGPQGGNCVEVRRTNDGIIQVRDSKDPHGPVLALTPAAWHTFIDGIKAEQLAL